MENGVINNYLVEWNDLIGDLIHKGQSVAIGIFNLEGRLLFANPSMCFFLDVDQELNQARNFFVNPLFSSLNNDNKNGLVFEGLMTIGN